MFLRRRNEILAELVMETENGIWYLYFVWGLEFWKSSWFFLASLNSGCWDTFSITLASKIKTLCVCTCLCVSYYLWNSTQRTTTRIQDPPRNEGTEETVTQNTQQTRTARGVTQLPPPWGTAMRYIAEPPPGPGKSPKTKVTLDAAGWLGTQGAPCHYTSLFLISYLIQAHAGNVSFCKYVISVKLGAAQVQPPVKS